MSKGSARCDNASSDPSAWSDIFNPLSDLGFPLSIDDVRAAREVVKLDGCWVVILLDPEGGDWSPWSVIAFDRKQAISLARQDWCEWCEWEGEPDYADVLKVYRDSWIGEIA